VNFPPFKKIGFSKAKGASKKSNCVKKFNVVFIKPELIFLFSKK
jgi:hypothetical protein